MSKNKKTYGYRPTQEGYTPKKSVHTVPSGKGWVNKASGKVTSAHATKRDAVAAGRQQAKNAGGEHRIHNKDGKISRSNVYSNDPHPPRDRSSTSGIRDRTEAAQSALPPPPRGGTGQRTLDRD